MAGVFLDSSAWIAILVPRDQRNRAALSFYRTLGRTPIITTDYVLAETLTWLTQSGYKRYSRTLRSMVAAGKQLRMLQVSWVTEQIHERAWDLYDRYDDQEFSFTDCTSFVICSQHEVDFVFTFDSDFRILGFDVRP